MGVNPFALLEGTMAFETPWGFNDCNMYDAQQVAELEKRLFNVQWEYEHLKISTANEMRKKEEEIQRLTDDLKLTRQERDEATKQLHILQLLNNKLMPMSTPEPESPQLWRPKANSVTTESDSYSDTGNRHSFVSSPVELFFDTNTSPELSSINMADSCCIAVHQNPMYRNNSCNSSPSSSVATAYARLEQLACKRPLPQKGKLMDAVMKAGPLLQNILVAGPLPRWKNPPPPQQQHQIPPVSVKDRNVQTLNQTAALSAYPLIESSPLVALRNEPSQSGLLVHGPAMKRPPALPLQSQCVASSQCSTASKRMKFQ